MDMMKGISHVMEKAKEEIFSGSFMKAAGVLSDSKLAVREELQGETAEKVRGIIAKLKGTEPLTSEDIAYIKLWIVGDAESYTKMENDFESWLSEFQRLKTVLSGYEERQLETSELFKLQGILEDAVRVASDIGNYLEKKERITKFEEAVKDPASLDRKILEHVLNMKLVSPEM